MQDQTVDAVGRGSRLVRCLAMMELFGPLALSERQGTARPLITGCRTCKRYSTWAGVQQR
jgi:hypothetical protein